MFGGEWYNYYGILTSGGVLSQSQCETQCLNNAACKSYQCWGGYTICSLFFYKNGITSVSTSLHSSLVSPFQGSVNAVRN